MTTRLLQPVHHAGLDRLLAGYADKPDHAAPAAGGLPAPDEAQVEAPNGKTGASLAPMPQHSLPGVSDADAGPQRRALVSRVV